MFSRIESIARRYPNLAATILFLLITVVAARPFLNQLDRVIIGLDNDVYINPWADWWTEKALTEPDLQLWQTDYLFYPQGANLTYHSFSHLNTAASLLLKPLLGSLVAYNVVILLNYLLAAISMFQLARYLTGSLVAGILGGIVFAFNSHSMYQSTHPVLVSIWCFPWVTLFLLRAIDENSFRLAIIAAFVVFFGAATSTLLLILMSIWFLVFGVHQLIAHRWKVRSWRLLALFAIVSGVLCLPMLLPLLREAIYGNDSFVMNPGNSFNTNIIAPVVPHWIYWYSRGLYVGIVPAFLTFNAIRGSRSARFWLTLAVGSFLFAIGPEPRFFNISLDITLPWPLLIAPVLRNMYRVNILLALGLAMLTAFGWVSFHQRLPSNSRIRTLVILIVTLLLLIDFLFAPIPFTSIRVSPFYTDFMEMVPDDVALATVPFGRQQDKRHLFYQTIHGHRITGGVISRAEADTFSFILGNPLLRAGAADLETVPLPTQPLPHLKELADVNIGFLVIDKTLTKNVDVWRQAIPLAPAYEDDLVLVYETD